MNPRNNLTTYDDPSEDEIEEIEAEFRARVARMARRRHPPNPHAYDSDVDYYSDLDAWSYVDRHPEEREVLP